MPSFGEKSLKELKSLHPDLQSVLKEAIKDVDFTILEGLRGKDEQDAAYAKGLSKLRFPQSKHNKIPSLAADIAPFPIDWSNKATALARFAFVSGVIWAAAQRLQIKVRFGWDWNRNLDPRDESFLDWPHVELDGY